MTIRVSYESGISGTFEDIQADRLDKFAFEVEEHAEEGSVAISQIPFDDPDGDLDLVGWRRVRIWDTASSATGSNSLMYTGWTYDRDITRGTYSTEAGRLWTAKIADENVALGFRLFVFNQANRPSETDVARVNWLGGAMASFGRAPLEETDRISQTNAVLMDAADYRGQSPLDILNDCAQASGKNFYLYSKDNGASVPTRGLWYGFGENTTDSSPLRLTNVLADVDSVWTFEILRETKLNRNPDRVISGAYVQSQAPPVYEQRASTYNQFTQRDATVSAPNVKSTAAATRRATRYLDDLDTEDDRIETGVYLPAAKVNFLKKGMRVQFRATHLPQYESPVWLRVLSRRIKYVSDQDAGIYLVSLTLASDSIPAQPVVTEAITTVLEATLRVGSAAHLGLGADREQHWASNLGIAGAAMVPGRQYRLVATVVACLTTPPNGTEHMSSCGVRVNASAGVSGTVWQPTYTWVPSDGTETAQNLYEGISYAYKNTGGMDAYYDAGTVTIGDWLRFDGPAISAADISIHGLPKSGFYGFDWTVHVELQSRAVP